MWSGVFFLFTFRVGVGIAEAITQAHVINALSDENLNSLFLNSLGVY